MAQTTPTVQTPTRAKPLKRKNPVIVALLQCIPLLGAAGCASMGATNQSSSGVALLLWCSVLFWGLGYSYLGRTYRFLTVFLIGPVFALTSCTYSLSGSGFDYEHSYGNVSPATVNAANIATIQEALIIAAAVLLLTVDALRLTVAHNAQLTNQEQSPGKIPPKLVS